MKTKESDLEALLKNAPHIPEENKVELERLEVADFNRARTPKIDYRSGSLENTDAKGPVFGIREEVCSILEGGTEAFKLREQRYALS